MKTRHLLLLAALALSGTGTAPLRAQQPAWPQAAAGERTIRAAGTGQVQATPDEAFLDFGVESTAATARAAAEQNARAMERVIRALVAAGIARSEIETRNYSVYPEHLPPAPGRTEPTVRGYRASNTVAVRTGDMSRVGALIDAALQAGANRVQGIRYGLTNVDALRQEAIRRAVATARAEARAMADALGLRLGPVLDASTASTPFRPMPMAARMEMAEAADAATPVEPGEQTVAATVTLVFRIEGGS